MKTLFMVLALALAVSAALDLENFDTYQKHFGKVYKTKAELTKRAQIFHANVEDIKAHNEKFARKKVTFSKAINQFTDMTDEEYFEFANGLPTRTDDLKQKYPSDDEFVRSLHEKFSKVKAPASVDWREKGGVTHIKNQGQCGSCAAFATIVTMETCFFLATGQLEDLSEQFLVDCGKNHYWDTWGAFGCSGAWPQAYYDYILNNEQGRVQHQSSYPYEATDYQGCRASQSGYCSHAKMTSWRNVWNADEETVKEWLASTGTVQTTIYAGRDFGSYGSGVLVASDCCDMATDPSCDYRNNHAVTIIGYDHDHQTGLDYWLIKNSWGTNWGMSGFLKIKRGTGHCGLLGHSASGPDQCTR
jgi:C1A family cysteine protease